MTDRPYDSEGEHPCERLIRIIQSREGAPTKAQREEAFVELLTMFRPLIRRVASTTYAQYNTYLRRGHTEESWYHDTVSMVVELVLTDYVPKAYGGRAMFGPYIKTKLWFRMLYAAQTVTKQCAREAAADMHGSMAGSPDKFTLVPEIAAALYAQMSLQSECTFEIYEAKELRGRIDELMKIAERVLTPYDYFIWREAIFSEKTFEQIGEAFPASWDSGKPQSRNKKTIFNHFCRARDKVLVEYAKLQIAGKL